MTKISLAIVGGGPSASCVVQAIAHHLAPMVEVDVTVFEPGPNLWRGRVFQADGDEVLANVPMSDMSARAWNEDHGVRWLRDHGHGDLVSDVAFPARSLVGRYLEDTTSHTVEALRAAGSRVRIERSLVRSLVLDKGKLRLHGDGWHAGPFDHAVLCLGAQGSYDHYQLARAPGFVGDPYPLFRSLAEVPSHARVGIVGSGLTAVDVVMALRARGHQGPITMASRNGLLPAVRRPPVRHDLCHLTVSNIERVTAEKGGLTLEDVIDLAKAELRECGAEAGAIADDLGRTTPAVRRLRDDLAHAHEDSDPGWPVLRDGMVACGQDAWYLLSEPDKARVRTRHQTLMRHCCPMPPANAARVLDLFDTGRLGIVRGIRSIRPATGGGFEIGAERDVTVDVVINASTPADHLPPPEARSLFASLSAQGLIVSHPFGGLRIGRTTSRLITWRGVADPRLHALGDITHGAYLFTFGMPVLAARAERIVHDIAITVAKGIKRDNLPVRHGQGTAHVEATGLRQSSRGAGASQEAADRGGAPVRVLRV